MFLLPSSTPTHPRRPSRKPRKDRIEITIAAWLGANIIAIAALAACGGALPGSSENSGSSTIDWENLAAYEENCILPLESSVSQTSEDSTIAEWSEALGEDLDAWESQDLPKELDAYDSAVTDFIKKLKEAVDSLPGDANAQEVFDNEGIEERLDEDFELINEAWEKFAPLVRYRLGGSDCFRDVEVNVELAYVDDYYTMCGSYECTLSGWYLERDGRKLTFEVALSNLTPDSEMPLPDCSDNLVIRDGDGMFYGASSCEFSGTIRGGKIPYGESPENQADVGISLEYDLPESANDLELLAAFELDNEVDSRYEGYIDDEGNAEGFIFRLSDIER